MDSRHLASALIAGISVSLSGCALDVGTSDNLGQASQALCAGPMTPGAGQQLPLPVTHGGCSDWQNFQATSPNAAYGSCGWIVGVEEPNNLLRPARYRLSGGLATPPPTEARCQFSRVTISGWGFGCATSPCRLETWHYLGEATSWGVWESAGGGSCSVQASLMSDGSYEDLQVAVEGVELIPQGSPFVTRRASRRVWGRIRADDYNGTCISATRD